MNIDRPQVSHLPWMELFLIHGSLVACQQAYTFAYHKETYHEVMHFYCPSCGDVWGTRVQPEAPASKHRYYRRMCEECGGLNDMLLPWEWSQLDVLAPNVMAYLILQKTQEVDNETGNHTAALRSSAQ